MEGAAIQGAKWPHEGKQKVRGTSLKEMENRGLDGPMEGAGMQGVRGTSLKEME
jgi:hypothetical protein